jgi:hypothetical protein
MLKWILSKAVDIIFAVSISLIVIFSLLNYAMGCLSWGNENCLTPTEIASAVSQLKYETAEYKRMETEIAEMQYQLDKK